MSRKPDQPGFDVSIIEAFKRSRFDALEDFNPEKYKLYLQQFHFGRLRYMSLLIDAVEERDDVLITVVPKAKAAVARHGWDIVVGETADDGEKALGEKQKQVLRNFYSQLRVRNALDQDELGGVSLLLRQMMDAKSKRYAVHNIVLKPGDMPTAVLWFTPLWFFENATGKLRFIDQPFGYDGVEMAADEWLVTKGLGIGIACVLARLYKQMTLRDWVIYSARTGIPGIEGITDAAIGSEQWRNMERIVALAASEMKWVRNRTEEIKPLDFGGKAGELPMPALVDRMDRALSAMWRGADLSTMSAGGGKGQGALVQQEETDLLEQDDAQWLTETINLKLDRLVLDYVFGPDAPSLAKFRVLTGEKKNVEVDLKVDAFALANGHPISSQQFADRYDRPVPDAGEELLVPRAANPTDATDITATPDPLAALNEKSAPAGREQLFLANAAAARLAAKRPVFRPLAQRIASLLAIADPEKFRSASAQLKVDSPKLFAAIVAKVPALAEPTAKIIGTAFADGVAEAAQARTKTEAKP